MKKIITVAACAAALLQAEVVGVKPVQERSFVQSQYIPDISLVFDASYASRNKDQDELAGIVIPGISEDVFSQGEGDGHGHSHSAYSSNNGFNLNYAELIFSANVDPSFSLDAIFHFTEDEIGIEEAYFTNTTLADGVRIRGGKLLSDFGRLNKQHPHFWDFNEAPLIYEGFLGYNHLNELGVQVQYTLPLDEYVMIGAELFQGQNEKSFGNESIALATTVDSVEIESAPAPSMFVGYLKTSFDIGNTTIMPGVSYVYGQSRLHHDHGGHEVAFDGKSSLYNAEFTIKHYFDSYSFLTWQSEWMHLDREGDEYHAEDPALPIEKEAQRIKQEGYYSQLVYAHDQNIRIGARYESIYKNDYAFIEETLPSKPFKKYTAMAEYHFSEFSRLRLEYIHNNALYKEGAIGFESEDVNTLLLSVNFSIGAHGAHDF